MRICVFPFTFFSLVEISAMINLYYKSTLSFINSNIFSDNDSDAEKKSKKVSDSKELEVDDDPDAPLSRPPSPFLSADHYYANLKNRASGGKKTGSKSNRPSSQNSDRMSLSRLKNDSIEIFRLVTLLKYKCFSTETCKTLLSTPHSKI